MVKKWGLMKYRFNGKLTENTHHHFLPTVNGIFGVAEYFGVSKYRLKFSSFYSFIIFLMLFTLESCAIWKFITVLASDTSGTGGIMVARLSGSIFYGNALLSLILSSRFMTSWENLSTFWLNTELVTRLNIPSDDGIRKRSLFVAVFVGFWAIVEHVLSMMSATGLEIQPETYFQRYILSSHGFLLRPHEYTIWLAVPIFVLSKIATALWNFQDLIIILISMGLASRYHRLNLYVLHLVQLERRLRKTKKFGSNDLYLHVQIWRRVREAYVHQAALVRITDQHLGALVLLSTINNLYFICLQLYLGFHREKGSPIQRAYYLLSLSWLLFRACSVVLAAADVHIHSRKALISLYMCPSAAYNNEINRLIYQLKNDCVTLTGMGLFSLKRESLLEVAGTVVKYELVLIQYDN